MFINNVYAEENSLNTTSTDTVTLTPGSGTPKTVTIYWGTAADFGVSTVYVKTPSSS